MSDAMMSVQGTTFVPTPDELVEYLLAETDQRSVGRVQPQRLIEVLDLRAVTLDFARHLADVATVHGQPVRALLDAEQRLVVVDASLKPKRACFSTLHEVAHYALPQPLAHLTLCTDADLSFGAARSQEREANWFAAEMLFKGRLFRLHAARLPITSQTVKELAEAFGASFEATARHVVETSIRPCLLAVYEETEDEGTGKADARDGKTGEGNRATKVRYSVASPAFRERFGANLIDADNPNVAEVWQKGRDITDSVVSVVDLQTAAGTRRFRAEYFFNGYNAFGLLTPAD